MKKGVFLVELCNPVDGGLGLMLLDGQKVVVFLTATEPLAASRLSEFAAGIPFEVVAEDTLGVVSINGDIQVSWIKLEITHCRFPRRIDPGFPLRTDPA